MNPIYHLLAAIVVSNSKLRLLLARGVVHLELELALVWHHPPVDQLRSQDVSLVIETHIFLSEHHFGAVHSLVHLWCKCRILSMTKYTLLLALPASKHWAEAVLKTSIYESLVIPLILRNKFRCKVPHWVCRLIIIRRVDLLLDDRLVN